MKSRGYVRENFAWRHYYWYLTNEDLEDHHETVTVVTEIRTDGKGVMLVWTREVPETISNQNSEVEWEVLEEDVVDHHQVEDLEHHHQARLLQDVVI